MARPYDDPEPVNEDEWYDPTDWFDGNNIEWDDTYDANEIYRDAGDDGWYDTYYGDTYYGDGYDLYDDGYSYQGDFTNDFTNDDDYGWHYEWNSRTNSWDREYGWHDSYYETADNYGTHYVWNPEQDRWQQKYGWYDDYYSYQPRTSYRQAVSSSSADARTGNRGSRPDQNAGQTAFAGTVDSFNRKRIQGQHASHTLVKVRLRDGSARTIDLGPRVDLEELDLAQGDSIRVRGRTGTIAGRTVLMASNLSVDNQSIPTRWNPAAQPHRRMERGSQQPGMMDRDRTTDRGRSVDRGRKVTCEGTLAGFHETSIDGVSDGHLLVRLRMKDGSSRVVDLGPSARMSELDLDKNDRVMIRGHKRTVGGKTILVAERLKVDGDQVSLKEAAQKKSAGSKSGSSKAQEASAARNQ